MASTRERLRQTGYVEGVNRTIESRWADGEPSFRKTNLDNELGKPFVYVDMTGLDRDTRFDKHKAGMEVALGIGLQERGFGIWQA